MQYAMMNILIFVTFGYLVTLSVVSAETYYIVATENTTSCSTLTTPIHNASFPTTPTNHTPVDENHTCLTLTQFAQLWSLQPVPSLSDINITLNFVPGNHTLHSRIQIQNVTNLVLQVLQMNVSSPLVAMVMCENSSGFIFEDISEVNISGLAFNGCRENSVRSVDQLRLEDCRLQNGHGMELRNVMNATLERSSFISLTAFVVQVQIGKVAEVRGRGRRRVGGAIAIFRSDLLVVKCLFESNWADFGSVIWTDSTISIESSHFSDNTANSGGVIWTDSGSITINGSHFSNNTADNEGGAIWTRHGSITIHDSNFSSNTADNEGGAIWTRHGSITIHDSNFSYNTADNGGTIWTIGGTTVIHDSHFSKNTADDDGGAIWTWSGSITIHNSNFSNNDGTSHGGAIYTDRPSTTNIQSSHFIANNARYGGAILSNGDLFICDCTLDSNSATNGGAVAVYGGNIDIYDSTFNNNRITHNGAAIYIRIVTFRRLVPHFYSSRNVNIVGCNFSNNSAGAHRNVSGNAMGGAILAFYFSKGTTVKRSILIQDCFFTNNKALTGGAIWMRSSLVVNIHDSIFSNNIAYRDGGAIWTESDDTIIINNCIFHQNQAGNLGGVIFIHSATLIFQGFVQITNNSAMTGVIFASHSTLLLSGNTTISDNKASFYAFASNVTFAGETIFTNNVHMDDSSIEEGGAVTSFQSEIVLAGTVKIMYNSIQQGNGGAILSSESKIYSYGDTVIANNTAQYGGGIYAYQSEFTSSAMTNIAENMAALKGGGIYVVGSTIKLTGGHLCFTVNRAKRGGGVYLELNAKLYIIKVAPICEESVRDCQYIQSMMYSPQLHLVNNSADYGGAVYVSDDTNSGTCAANTDQSTSSECFFQDLALHSFNHHSLIVRDVFFVGNTANTLGGTIFGGLLERCTVSPYAEVFNKYQFENINVISYLTNVTGLQKNDIKTAISSQPVRMCFCGQDNQIDCDCPPPTYSVKKGETFKVSLVAVDQIGNPLPSSVRAFLSSNLGGLGEGQNTQNIPSECTELNFTITSPRDSEQLVLYADGPCNDLGISQSRVNVTFLPCDCPIGFVASEHQSNCSCECDPCLSDYTSECCVSKSSVQRRDNIWISYVNETDLELIQCPYLIYPHCPFDYCHPSTTVDPVWINLNIPNGSDAQCAFNRSGKLCGSCKDGLSLTLGSSRCMSCSNNWLALLIVFAIAGVALVAFLLIFNLTVAVGTMNGLLFYANILAINHATFFPFDTPTSKLKIFTIFIAWLNLDFGFVTCFSDGMDGYAKQWLQLAFPIYIILMVAMVIIGCEYSTRIATFFTGTNPVATLATLILLSYTKSVRLVIAALSYATLEYPDGSQEKVWLTDASIFYFEGKHIPLFLIALFILLIGIVYTSLLFSYQWLLRCPNRRALKWIKNARFYPFMDAYLAPYNLKHRYWTGLLLLIRAFLYVVAAFSVSGDPGNNLISIIFTLVCLLLFKVSLIRKIYKSWPLDALENSFIFNLILFSAGSLYIRATRNGNLDALAYTSTAIAFVTFLGIFIYHAYTFILSKKLRKRNVKPRIKLYLRSLFSKTDTKPDIEIIRIPKTLCTYSVIDGPGVEYPENDTTIQPDTSNQATHTQVSNMTGQSSTDRSRVDNDIDGQQKGSVDIELLILSSPYSLIPHDSEEFGMERETELRNNFNQ